MENRLAVLRFVSRFRPAEIGVKKKRVVNTPEMWVRRESAFDPIISPEDFFTARGIIVARIRRLTDDEMLDRLRALLAKHSLLSSGLIDSAEGMPASSAYRTRFGSLLRAYQLAGYRPDRDYGFLEVNRTIGRLHPQFLDDMVKQLGGVGAQVSRDAAADLLVINGEYTLPARLRAGPPGSVRQPRPDRDPRDRHRGHQGGADVDQPG